VEALEALLSENLEGLGRVQEFHFRLSEIIRRYLGDRYDFNAIDLTTYELLERLPDLDVPGELLQLMTGFNLRCDLVKFADHVPSPDELNEAVQLAREVLSLTRPQPVLDTVPDAAPATVEREA